MTTAAHVVSRALRLIQVIDQHQDVGAREMETAIVALNAMLRRWEADGISLGWVPVNNPVDVLSLPEEAEEAVAYNLAVKLASEYGVAASATVMEEANDGHHKIARDQMVATPIRPILSAPTPANYRSNTLNGSSWYNG